MILCRKCTTRHDDGVEQCTECGADLTGPDGLRLGSAMRTDWNPSEVRPAPRSEVPPSEPTQTPSGTPEPAVSEPAIRERQPPVEPPVPQPSTFGESGVIVRPDRDRPRSPDEAERQRRRGRRPGEVSDDDLEPETNEILAGGGTTPDVGEQLAEDADLPTAPALREPALLGSHSAADTPGPESEHSDAESPAAAPMPNVPRASFVVLGENEVGCPTCRRPNDERRRFCSYCAATLPAFGSEGDEREEVGREPLIRRLLGTRKKDGRDSRTFAQRAKDSGQQKMKYRAKYTLQSRLRAVGYIGGGAAGLLLMLGPVRNRVMTYFNPPDPISVEQVVVEGGTPFEEESFQPKNAADGDPETAFVLPWTGEPTVFSFQLPGGRSPRRIEFETGYPNSDLDRGSLYLRPHEIELSAAGETQTITLDDHEGAQRVKFGLPDDASTITVTILTVHEPTWPTYERVAIAEIKIVR